MSERVYLATGTKAHLVNSVNNPPYAFCICCGKQPALGGYWLGTGSMAEYEKAAALPLCKAGARR